MLSEVIFTSNIQLPSQSNLLNCAHMDSETACVTVCTCSMCVYVHVMGRGIYCHQFNFPLLFLFFAVGSFPNDAFPQLPPLPSGDTSGFQQHALSGPFAPIMPSLWVHSCRTLQKIKFHLLRVNSMLEVDLQLLYYAISTL